MQTSVIVLGAGMVGTCTALHLALCGHEVTLLDRRGPGEETSYGNAGLIQREAVSPYAFPRDLATLWRVANKRGADVHYHLRALPALLPALATYWRHSAPARHARIAQDYARLIAHCTDEHQALIDRANANDLVRRDGYLSLFHSSASLAAHAAEAQALATSHGLRHAELDAAALAQAEPALRTRLAGAIHWQDTWAVSDPGELVVRYAALFQRLGGQWQRGDAMSLQPAGSGWRVQTADGPLEAAHVVVALGPWSDGLLRRLGYRYPLLIKRGYHRHYRGGPVPNHAWYDVDRGLVLAPMKRGVRLTTGAEFAHLEAPPTPVQLHQAHRLATELLDLPEAVEPQPWLGARPCTGDMLPVTGPAPRHAGLWFNFGHAHQGFTLGPVSGRLLAEMIEGQTPWLDPAPYLPARFG